MATIDTLALAERLEREDGDDPERARRHARILGDMAAASDVATRQDIKDLSTEIGQLRTEMGHKLDALRGELQQESGSVRGEIGQLRTEVEHKLDVVHGEIGQLRTEMEHKLDALRGELQHEIGTVHGGIGQLRTEMHEMEARLRIETQSEGNKLRAELHKEIAGVRGDMGNLAWKVAGLLVAQAAVIIALLRLLPGGAP